jgi:hypothetical protein
MQTFIESTMIARIGSVFMLTMGLLLTSATAQAQRIQQVFKTPQAAMEEFGYAVKIKDDLLFRLMLGDDYKTFIPSPTKEDYQRFLAAWDKTHKIVMDNPQLAHIGVGEKGWTLPIPLVKQGTDWRFDLDLAVQEMKQRSIGANEIAVIRAMLAYGDAQMEYAEKDRMGDGVLQYAQRLQSTPGTKDGLYWPTNADEPRSPIGEYFAESKSIDGIDERGFHGYLFKVLTSQGRAAPGGVLDYIVNGRMIGGYALLAWPVIYGETGVMTFMVNHAGQIYQKNLGLATPRLAKQISTFNPDATWQKVSKDDL